MTDDVGMSDQDPRSFSDRIDGARAAHRREVQQAEDHIDATQSRVFAFMRQVRNELRSRQAPTERKDFRADFPDGTPDPLPPGFRVVRTIGRDASEGILEDVDGWAIPIGVEIQHAAFDGTHQRVVHARDLTLWLAAATERWYAHNAYNTTPPWWGLSASVPTWQTYPPLTVRSDSEGLRFVLLDEGQYFRGPSFEDAVIQALGRILA